MTTTDIEIAPRAMFTGSSLDRTQKCAVSAVLPQVRSASESADLGSAIHEHMAIRATRGVSVAVEMIPETAKRHGLDEKMAGIFRARCMHFEWSPPRGAMAEVPLCICEDGHVETTKGGKGRYVLPPGGFYALTIDVLWAEPEPLHIEPCDACKGVGKIDLTETHTATCKACGGTGVGRVTCPPSSTLWVGDYKSGAEVRVEAVEENLQVLSGALLAARWTGAQRVYPVVIYPRKGKGLWDTPLETFTTEDLARVEAVLMRTWDRVKAQRDLVADGKLPAFEVGPHCEHCSAETLCAGKWGKLRTFIELGVPAGAIEWTDEELARFAETLPQVERLASAGKEFLKKVVQARGRPIQLSGGRLWGPHVMPKTVVKPKVALPILAAEIGEEEARAAVKPETLTREAMEAAVKKKHLELGIVRKGAETMRRIMGQVIGAGGTEKADEVWWSAYKPGPEEQAEGIAEAFQRHLDQNAGATVTIAKDTGLSMASVAAVMKLLDGGSDVAFIARYRKEETGGLDEVQIGEIVHRLAKIRSAQNDAPTEG